MALVSVYESTAKRALYDQLRTQPGSVFLESEALAVELGDELDVLSETNPWLMSSRLVVKVDQLVKGRGLSGLVGLDLDWEAVKEWVGARRGRIVTAGGVEGRIDRFLIEPFVPHREPDERYVCLRTVPEGDELLVYHRGGVDVDQIDEVAARVLLDPEDPAREVPAAVKYLRLGSVDEEVVAERALVELARAAAALNLAYMEINPFVVTGAGARILDLAVKADDAVGGPLAQPVAPFGFELSDGELRVRELDARTGASLKLTLLNPNGRIWLLIAGGGASMAIADTVFDLGAGAELANYGEYSGDPSEAFTYEYARIVFELMTEGRPSDGAKALLIGGAVANFTDVAVTFAGIARALREFAPALRTHGCRVYVRRGGPNAEAGLSLMREVCDELGLPAVVQKSEATLTSIVARAIDELGLCVEDVSSVNV